MLCARHMLATPQRVGPYRWPPEAIVKVAGQHTCGHGHHSTDSGDRRVAYGYWDSLPLYQMHSQMARFTSSSTCANG